jgi:hypothetical protein
MSSMLGRSATSRSQSAMGYIRRPNGYASMTMVLSRATTAPKGPMSNHTSSTCTPPPIIASTHPSNLFWRGSSTCLLAQAVTSRFYKKLWPTPEIGALPEKSLNTDNSMMTSRWWPSILRSTSTTWMPPARALGPVSLDLCSHGPWRGSLPYKTC